MEDVRSMLNEHGIRPERRLGQYFLTDEGVATRMVTYAGVTRDDTVLEIGAGTGSLTEHLNRAAKKVYAVERDQALVALLRERFEAKASATEILEGDVLEISLPMFDKVVASIPFMISARLTYKLLYRVEADLGLAVLLVQQEFAEKLVAAPRTDAYGRLSVLVQALTEVAILETVPRNAFYPPAPVTGAVVRLQESEAKRNLISDKAQIFEFVTAAFAQRRKKLRAIFKHGLEQPALQTELEQRPEELTPEAFARLAAYAR